MAYALMALMAVRELYRHIAKMAGWEPRYRPMRNHLFNAVFSASALVIALGSLLEIGWVATVGWCVCGVTIIGGTTVPCGWSVVNNDSRLWYPRQAFFLVLGTGVLAFALGAL